MIDYAHIKSLAEDGYLARGIGLAGLHDTVLAIIADVERITAERDAAIARAERAEADNDALRKQIATRTEALQTANGTNASLRARAEAAEALAASRPEIAPEMAAMWAEAIDIAPWRDPTLEARRAWEAVTDTLRAHAAKVSR